MNDWNLYFILYPVGIQILNLATDINLNWLKESLNVAKEKRNCFSLVFSKLKIHKVFERNENKQGKEKGPNL